MSPKLAAMISCRPSAPRPNGNRASVADRAGLMRKMPSAERASNSIMFLFCSCQVLSRSSPRNHFEIHEIYFAAAWFCGEREADRQRRISPRRGISKRSGLQLLNGMTRRVTVGCDAAGCLYCRWYLTRRLGAIGTVLDVSVLPGVTERGRLR